MMLDCINCIDYIWTDCVWTAEIPNPNNHYQNHLRNYRKPCNVDTGIKRDITTFCHERNFAWPKLCQLEWLDAILTVNRAQPVCNRLHILHVAMFVIFASRSRNLVGIYNRPRDRHRSYCSPVCHSESLIVIRRSHGKRRTQSRDVCNCTDDKKNRKKHLVDTI